MRKIVMLLLSISFLVPLAFSQARKVRVTAGRAALYYQPRTSSEVFEVFGKGTILNVLGLGEKNGWFNVSGRSAQYGSMISGFILASQVEPIGGWPTPVKEESAPALKSEEAAKAQEVKAAEPIRVAKTEQPAKVHEKKAAEAEKPTDVRPPAEPKETIKREAVPAPVPVTAVSDNTKALLKRFSIHLGYNMGLSSQSQSVSWSRQIYYENATFGVGYGAKKGNSFAVSLGYNFVRSLGIEIGASFTSRDLGADYSASIPHPLQFGELRASEGKASYQVGENAFFLNLVLSVPMSQFELDLFAGPAYFTASADVLSNIQYSQSYPYTSISLSAQNEKINKNIVGFNAGARLKFNFTQSVGIFASGQYFSGSAEFKPADVPGLKLSLGGLKAGGGISISF